MWRLHRAVAAGGRLPRAERSLGLQDKVARSLTVAGGEAVSLNVALEVGTAQQTVEVSGNAQALQIKTASTRYRKWLVDDLPVVVNGGVRGPYDMCRPSRPKRSAATAVFASAAATPVFMA
jgi:hypothetical protein